MEKARAHGMTYCIHSFMCEELGLSGGELLVFAIIYSFTKGGDGTYYGTQDYLARSSGLSISTVKRSISSLLKKKYITECHYRERRGYKTAPMAEPGACGGKDLCSMTEETPALPNDAANGEFDIRDSDLYSAARPKYTFHSIGRCEIVRMTPEQYKSLLTLVEPEVLQVYTRKLELLITDKGYRTFNPYKTIKKWILEDSAV